MERFFCLEGIVKQYIAPNYVIQVLDELDLDIQKGEMIAITGKSGSGKSTLLHLMGLLDFPNSGKIYYLDQEITTKQKGIELFRNRHIGFVFQSHYLLADFNAWENVAIPNIIQGHNIVKAKQIARSLLLEFDLENRLEHYPNQLSGGEQQRVAIARALINNPDVILADEPTGNLDKNHAEEIIQTLKKINKKINQTIVIATHDFEIAESMDKHYHLENGKLILK